MKHIIEDDNYEMVVKNLQQAQSLAFVLSCDVNENKDKTNIYWIIQDLVQSAKDLIVDSKQLTN